MVTIRTLYINDFLCYPVDIECALTSGLPGFVFSGRAGKIIEESSIRVKQALRNCCNININAKIVINLIPSDIQKNTNLFDLPLAIAILLSASKIELSLSDILILGELTLSGKVKTTSNIIPYLFRAVNFNFKSCIVPENNTSSILSIPIKCYNVSTLDNAWKIVQEEINGVTEILSEKKDCQFPRQNIEESNKLNDTNLLNFFNKDNAIYFNTKTTKKFEQIIIKSENNKNDPPGYDFSNYSGGESIKRVLTIAAAGFHSIHIAGPSGTGKTLLSLMFESILPPLTLFEQHELMDLYSQFSINDFEFIKSRPVRSPHHSSTVLSLVGGGTPLSIGEVSLAHRGVLILDEINLFNKKVLESLREPLEEQQVSISRVKNKINLPSSFLLFMISNLCYCGNFGSSKRICTCTEQQRVTFNYHISGALKDRVDIYFIINEEISNFEKKTNSSYEMYQQVLKAFEIQYYRYLDCETLSFFNGKVPKTQLNKYIHLDNKLEFFLFDYMKKKGQSFRKLEKVIKVARTIADLEGKKDISKANLLESLYLVVESSL